MVSEGSDEVSRLHDSGASMRQNTVAGDIVEEHFHGKEEAEERVTQEEAGVRDSQDNTSQSPTKARSFSTHHHFLEVPSYHDSVEG